MRRVVSLLLLFSLSSGISAQDRPKSRVGALEDLHALIQEKTRTAKDSNGLKPIVDSIAKQGDEEKTEYARFFVNLEQYYQKGLNALNASEPKRFAALAGGFKSPAIKALLKFYWGQDFCNQSKYTQGIELMLEAVSQLKAVGYQNVPNIFVPFYLVSGHYYNFNNYRKCIEYAELASKFGDRDATIGLYNTWGLAYQKLEIYDSAVLRFKETIRHARMHNVPAWEYIASGNLGRIYCLQGRFAEGIPLLYTDVSKDSTAEPANAAISSLYMAEAYTKLRQADSVAYFIELAKKIFIRQFQWNSDNYFGSKFCWYYYRVKAGFAQAQGRYAEALLYTDTAAQNEKKYNRKYDWQLLTATEKRIEGLEYQKDIALLDAEKANERLQKILLFLALASVLIIAGLIIKRQRLKQKKERQLAREKEANLRLKEEQARQELEAARTQLNDFIRRIDEKNQLREQITASLISIKGIATPGQMPKASTNN